MKKIFIFSVALATFYSYSVAQSVGVGTNAPNPDAMLDVTSSTKGLLVPRVALTATNSALPLSSFVTGMIVYSTATAGSSPNNVAPGYYYSDGNGWLRMLTSVSGWSLTGNAGTSSSH